MAPTEFDIVISITDLIFFPDENYDDVEVRYEFANILNYLNIKIDIPSLYYYYFDNVKGGEGDIYIYKNENNSLVIDLYKDEFDQIDLINVLIRHGSKASDEFNKMMSSFFNSSEYKISYTANFGSHILNRVFDEPVNQINSSKLDEFYKNRNRNVVIC